LWQFKKSLIMRIPKINLSFKTYSDADLLTKANHIASSIAANPAVFASPVPPLPDLQAAIATYSADLIAAASLGRVNVATKNQSRDVLIEVLVQLGRYVTYIAAGDENILILSGYTLAKEPQPRHLENPGTVTLSNGNTTGAMISFVKRGNANSYLHEIADTLPADSTTWTKFPSINSQFTFTSLTPGKQYWVRVAAIGYRNQVAYSTVATQFAQ
jgi:hypothetical protein